MRLPDQNPADLAEKEETVSYAFLVAMSRLNPVERAVFMFRDVFGYHYKEISSIIEKSEANCRKIHSRIKHKLSGELSLTSRPKEEQRTGRAVHSIGKNGRF